MSFYRTGEMTMDASIKQLARERMKGHCRVCPQCDGRVCAGEVPGMGRLGTGSSFRANVEALANVKLAMRCLHAGLGVKIIEQNHERCVELAELLPSAVIIEADGSRQDILAAEGISSTDAVITLTNMDEENLIISMYASHIGVPKVITKVNRTEYVEAFKSMGIDTFISPKALCSTDIVRYVRAMQNTTGGSVITLHRMVEGKAEALEFRASETTRHLGETLLDIQLKPEILIACITHKGRTIIPRGSDVFQAGDTVIVVTTSGQPINDLNDIFAD
mgnify:CR=1 FL=1